MKQITQREWSKTPDDYKLVKEDGTHMKLELTSEGTCLVPVEIVDTTSKGNEMAQDKQWRLVTLEGKVVSYHTTAKAAGRAADKDEYQAFDLEAKLSDGRWVKEGWSY